MLVMNFCHEKAIADAETSLQRGRKWRPAAGRKKPHRPESVVVAGRLRRGWGYAERSLAVAHELLDASCIARSLDRVGNWHMNTGRVMPTLAH